MYEASLMSWILRPAKEMKMQKPWSMLATKTRSEGDAGHVVLDEAVDIDDGGVVAELDARHQHEHQCDH